MAGSSAGSTTWATFGHDMALGALPPGFRACLPPSQPSAACDGLVGSAAEGFGYCASPAFARMTYCSCVNSSTGCPEYTMPQCSNAASSYKPAAWYAPGPGGSPSHDAVCGKAPVCVNIVDVASRGIASNITQQCGVISNIAASLKASPALALLFFVLLVALGAVLAARADPDSDDDGEDGRRGAAGPPPGSESAQRRRR